MPCRQLTKNKFWGWAPGSAFGPGASPDRGHSPSLIKYSTPAGHSPASHRAAKPVRLSKILRKYY